ncbi:MULTISPECIES: helix-turn-helix domain-containing protein [unclassified Paenibacillus]|uniref:helix-turn-helix domain-containing protein n=1 Tax=unclassified Paenibacillus TaxID=185978 RepID=UPI001AE22121|nr:MULTISPECIES: helix-turn-helix domain-containing protein [unclassified Paenibacillus]MBP1154389.1 XRE family transcriptional regulator of biofilm formation [Paenibacillus sp. PvP091]MBP1170227.1 XRE family transcriptional regulator of biofilm formation [Paenibacillus sp. PvR098]MBP2441255.1 XRE family transcriptional regulator of biofilm formation [Paenibacillus sp. PvP052]
MIGKRIKLYRQKKRLSLSELAKRAGVAKSYLSSIERNIQKNPSVDFLNKIADVLGVKIEALIKDEASVELTPSDKDWLQFSSEAKNMGVSVEMVRKFLELYSDNVKKY